MSQQRSSTGADWLGIERVSDDTWRLRVTSGVISGASALFGGCATAAAAVVAQQLAPQPVVFAATHFGALARLGTTVTIRARVIAAGRTLTHLEVEGDIPEGHSFQTRVTAGERPVRELEGEWLAPPDVEPPEGSRPFPQPVHEGTWAERFEFRLAGTSSGALAGTGRADAQPWAAWWVRPADDPVDPIVASAVLVDYVTYGIGRALGVPMGGLSVDNVLRVHRLASAEWYLLQVLPDAIEAGLGFGTARLYAEGSLVAVGTQSVVVNNWDWRLPDER